jgi:hypothetical protein
MNRHLCRWIPLLVGIAIVCSAAGQISLPEAAAQDRLRIDVERKQADANFEIQRKRAVNPFCPWL